MPTADGASHLTNESIIRSEAMPVVVGATDEWRRECVVCGSPYVAYVRHLPTITTKNELALFHCMDCKSFANPSGYVPSDDDHRNELEFHIKVHDRNVERSNQLLDALVERWPDVNRMIEVGCGTGTFVAVAQQRGFAATGYDINRHAIDHGRAELGADLRAEFWSAEIDEPFDLILCIMLLEHLEDPRPLLDELATAAKRYEAKVYVTVPFVERTEWHHIQNPDPTRPHNPFFNNDAHVTHFSRAGMEAAARRRGATDIQWIETAGWDGYVFDFAPPPVTEPEPVEAVPAVDDPEPEVPVRTGSFVDRARRRVAQAIAPRPTDDGSD